MYSADLRIQSRSFTTDSRNIKKSSRNTGNLIKINCSTGVTALNRNRAQSLLLCSLVQGRIRLLMCLTMFVIARLIYLHSQRPS